MASFDPTEHTHRRYNPLSQSWILCSPHRTKRPWQGAQESAEVPTLPEYDPKCYLCPGNPRATGEVTERYTSTFVFENDYAALKPDESVPTQQDTNPHPLIQSRPSRGKCFVICFNPAHNLTIANLTTAPYSASQHIVPIIQAWQKAYQEITQDNPFIEYVQIFENKGSAMGCSNPHPHGQVWSMDYVPEEPAKAIQSQWQYSQDERNKRPGEPRSAITGSPSLLLTYAQWEMDQPGRPRVVAFNEDFIAVVPYWAFWPFEILVLPRKDHINHVAALSATQLQSFAAIMGEVTLRYDNLFECSFPYSMGIHQRPIPPRTQAVNESQKQQERQWDEAQLHVHFYPPLLRSKTVKKFQVGFEMLGEPQRDLTAEQAAKRLVEVDASVHYTARLGK